MIKFGLTCESRHAFEGWFASSSEFDTQAKRGFVGCPICGSTDIRKSLQAPAVSTSRAQGRAASEIEAKAKAFVAAMRQVRDELTKDATDVGDRFATEAKAIHYGEKPQAVIYGRATKPEMAELAEEGIATMPLPMLPEEAN